MPPYLNANYDQQYAQAATGSTWTDPAQAGLNSPGWTKYLYEYAGSRAGELNAPALSYGPNDWYAVSAWYVLGCCLPLGACFSSKHSLPHPYPTHTHTYRMQEACPSSICRNADRSAVVDEAADAQKMAALSQAATMASQPNTGQHLLQFGKDHFSWYYLLARAGTQNGGGQLLKVKKELSAPSYNALRNANGKWSRDTLKANMDITNYPIFAGMRAATNVHMRDELSAQSQVINYGLGSVAALSPYPSNTGRYRGYRTLQEATPATETTPAQAKRNARKAKKAKRKAEHLAKKGARKGKHHKHKKWRKEKRSWLKRQGIPVSAAGARVAAANGTIGSVGGGAPAASATIPPARGDKGLLLPAKKPHLTMKEALARLAAAKSNKLAPILPPGPITPPPPLKKGPALKPVIPAVYHRQEWHPSAKPIPIVMGEHNFLHPKLNAHFNHPPMDYEHALCDQGYCPGRRRAQEEENETMTKMYVHLGHGNQGGGGGNKGMLLHHTHQMPKVTKLIPIEKPALYEGKHQPTIYKPLHRVYQAPEPSMFVIWAPKHTHPWLQHPIWGH